MWTLLGIGVFLSILFINHASEDEQKPPYKYASKVDLIQIYGDEWWANVVKPREWPFGTFNIVSNGPNKNPLDMASIRFWIVYKGNDTTLPILSQMSIQPGENVHTIMETFCDEAGFVHGPDSLACRGVELKGRNHPHSLIATVGPDHTIGPYHKTVPYHIIHYHMIYPFDRTPFHNIIPNLNIYLSTYLPLYLSTLTDRVSEVIYGLCYTSTRPLATMDDYVATRTTVITWLIHKYR